MVPKCAVRRSSRIKIIVKHYEAIVSNWPLQGIKKPHCNPWPELTTPSLSPVPAKILAQAPWCSAPAASSPRTGAHPVIQGIQTETAETFSFTVLHWRQVTLSQKCMKISKAPGTTELVISSMQVCLTLLLHELGQQKHNSAAKPEHHTLEKAKVLAK